jgi:competence protein ComEC
MIFAKLLSGIIGVLNFSVKIIEGHSFSVSRGVYINSIELALLFCLIFSIALFILIKKKFYLYLSLFATGLLFTSFTFRYYNNISTRKIIVYSVNKATAIDFIDGKNGIMFLDSTMISDESRVDYHIQNNRIISGIKLKEGLVPVDQDLKNEHLIKHGNFIKFYNKTMVMIDPEFQVYPSQSKLRVNYLLITHNPSITISELASAFDFDLIIIDKSNSFWKTSEWTRDCEQTEVNYYSVQNDGAFVLKV